MMYRTRWYEIFLRRWFDLELNVVEDWFDNEWRFGRECCTNEEFRNLAVRGLGKWIERFYCSLVHQGSAIWMQKTKERCRRTSYHGSYLLTLEMVSFELAVISFWVSFKNLIVICNDWSSPSMKDDWDIDSFRLVDVWMRCTGGMGVCSGKKSSTSLVLQWKTKRV